MTAEEANERANNVVKSYANTKLKEILVAIEEKVEKGQFVISLNISEVEHYSTVTQELGKLGYTLHLDQNYLEISW